MKKFFTGAIFLALSVLFVSCGFGTGFGSGVTTQPRLETFPCEVPNQAKGLNLYLVKVNHSTSVINSAYTGYVSNTNIIDDDYYPELNLPEINMDDVPENIPSSSVQKFNENIYKLNTISASRDSSADNTRVVKENHWTVGDTKTFNVEATDSYADKTAVCKYTNNYCNVWYIDSGKSYTISGTTAKENILINSKFATLGAVFASFVQAEEALCGPHTYTKSYYKNIIDPVDKIDIIVFDINGDGKSDQSGGTFGYFYSRDMFTQTTQNCENSNLTQCIYVDSLFLIKYEQMVHSTLVHEYNHLLNFVNKYVKYGKNNETWFTEMLSTVCEDLFMSKLSIPAQYSSRARFPFFVEGCNAGFKRWNNDNLMFYYANAFIFGSYLGRNYGGPELIHKIATNEYANEEAITKALNDMGYKYYIDQNGDTQPFTFSEALADEFVIRFNTKKYNVKLNVPKDENHADELSDGTLRYRNFTLNNSVDLTWETDSSIKFTGIDISQTYTNNGKEVNNLKILYQTSADKNNCRVLYPYGIDVFMIYVYLESPNVDTFNLTYNNQIGYYLYWSAE